MTAVHQSSYRMHNRRDEWSRLAEQFATDWDGWERAAFLELGVGPPLVPYPRALVYGCGIGADANALVQAGYAAYVEGWDRDGETIAAARQRYGAPVPCFRTIDLLADPAPMAIEPFDLVYLRFVLQHVPTDSVGLLLQRLIGLLRDGGRLLIHDVDRTAYRVRPADHVVAAIDQRIIDYLTQRGCDPAIGAALPGLMQAQGLHDLRLKIINQVCSHTQTLTQLSFAVNVQDDAQPGGRLVAAQVWQRACEDRPVDFCRVVTHVIVGATR